MGVPFTGPVKMSVMASEFGKPTPVSLSDFYGDDIDLPNSGTIRFEK